MAVAVLTTVTALSSLSSELFLRFMSSMETVISPLFLTLISSVSSRPMMKNSAGKLVPLTSTVLFFSASK